MYGCPAWRALYRKSILALRYWVDTFMLFFQARLGRIWYAPWIPVVELVLLVYILLGIPTIAIVIGSLVWAAILYAFIRVSMSRLSSSLWHDLERYIRCSRPVVAFANKLDKTIDYFRSGYIDEACMGLGILLMIYFSLIIGLIYSIMYPTITLLYVGIIVLGMVISSFLGF